MWSFRIQLAACHTIRHVRLCTTKAQVMSRVSPVTPSTILELANLLEQAKRAKGYLPNDVLSLCHWPELLQS